MNARKGLLQDPDFQFKLCPLAMSERGSKMNHLKVQQVQIHLLGKIKSQEFSITKNKVYTII